MKIDFWCYSVHVPIVVVRSFVIISLVIYVFALMETEVLLSCSKKQWILSGEFSFTLQILFLLNRFSFDTARFKDICNTVIVIAVVHLIHSLKSVLPSMSKTTNCCICDPRIIQFHISCTLPHSHSSNSESENSETSSHGLQMWINYELFYFQPSEL